MFRTFMALFLVFMAQGLLWAGDFNWGVKYGMGSSSLHGEEADYELHYDIARVGLNPPDFGYLKVRSFETKGDLSYQAGAYCSVPLFRNHDSVSLQTELLWHRYAVSHEFKDAALNTNQIVLATAFEDTLRGRIDKTLDYVTVPILIRMNQELPPEKLDRSYQGAFVYFGPSFSVLLNNDTAYQKGVKALEQKLEDEYNDGVVYTYRKVESGTDKLSALKADIVIGAGFAVKDIFKMGLCKDEFVFDVRFTASLNDLGDTPFRNSFNLRSIMLSIGSRL